MTPPTTNVTMPNAAKTEEIVARKAVTPRLIRPKKPVMLASADEVSAVILTGVGCSTGTLTGVGCSTFASTVWATGCSISLRVASTFCGILSRSDVSAVILSETP